MVCFQKMSLKKQIALSMNYLSAFFNCLNHVAPNGNDVKESGRGRLFAYRDR
jgi:hypothetical protein